MGSHHLVKRLRHEYIDRISDLPDEILCKILSYVSIKDVIVTSILSTRWKPLFPSSVSLVELDFGHSCKTHVSHKLMDILHDVTLRDLLCTVERIVLNVKDAYSYPLLEVPRWDSTITSWVAAFTRLNVQSFRLVSRYFPTIELFGSLHGCSTLVELEMGSFTNLHLSHEFILPNLKRLSLYEFDLDRGTNVKELLDGCPVLNDFRISKCSFGASNPFHIQNPNIKKLFVDGFAGRMRVSDYQNLEVDCPNLEVMVFKERYVANCVLKNINSLHSVCFVFSNLGNGNKDDNLTKLLKACSSTTRLCLTGNWATRLFYSDVPLPTFQNVTFVALGRLGRYGWRMLVRLLESAPNLAILTFEEELDLKMPHTESNSLLRSFADTDYKFLQPHSTRTDTDIKSSRPDSSLVNIKKIEIWEFKWRLDEMELIDYFLKEAEVLQELIVHCLPCENKKDLEKLSMLPRYSDTCRVLFKDKSNLGKPRYSQENWF